MKNFLAPVLLTALSITAAACSSSDASSPADPAEQTVGADDMTKLDDGKSDSSVEAIVVDFEFDAELVTTSSWRPRSKIQDQLLYTIGQLNGEKSVGRLDRVDLTNIQISTDDQNLTHIKYHAKLPVAWGKRNRVPTSYQLKLPLNVSYDGQKAFTEAYKHGCVEWGAHDVDSGSMWYYYRPNSGTCHLEDKDIVKINATVTVSDVNTTGKYPEYHKIWEDDQLRVLAVFGKFEDGSTSSTDAGISAYNKFVKSVRQELVSHDLVTVPEEVPSNPGAALPDVTFKADLGNGKTVQINALLVDNIRTADAAFNARYEKLSTNADLIAYNGHAGLGQNVRALARKGKWVKGQYAIVFLNGCDSYTYVDSALADAHMAVNPDDTEGTKYLDTVTNAMPSFFRSMSNASMAFVRGLMDYENPKTYERIFKSVDSHEVIIVSGEQDNVYFPGWPGNNEEPPVSTWNGMQESGTVARSEENHYDTPVLPAGHYEFAMTGDHDADLFVRIGEKPTKSLWDCRPYKTGSNETCKVDLTAPAKVFVMVRGWASSSKYDLAGSTVTE